MLEAMQMELNCSDETAVEVKMILIATVGNKSIFKEPKAIVILVEALI